MTTDELRKLALAASADPGHHYPYPTPDQEDFIRFCTPEIVLKLLDVIDAAKAMRLGWAAADPRPLAFDLALAQLESGNG